MSERKLRLPSGKPTPVGATPQRNDSVQEKKKNFSPDSSSHTRSDAEKSSDTSSLRQGTNAAERDFPKSPISEYSSEVDAGDAGQTPSLDQNTADRNRTEDAEPTRYPKVLPRSISAHDPNIKTEPTVSNEIRTSAEHRSQIKANESPGDIQRTTPVVTRRSDVSNSRVMETATLGENPPEDHNEWEAPIELKCNRLCVSVHSLCR
jgi:hypothetical protein